MQYVGVNKVQDKNGNTYPQLSDAAGRTKMSNGQPDPYSGSLTTSTSTFGASFDGFAVGTFYLSGTHAGFNVTFEQSPDSTDGTNGTWFATFAASTNANTVASTSGVLTTNTSAAYDLTAPGASYIRVRATARTSGTLNVMVTTSTANIEVAPSLGTQPVSGTVTSNLGTGGVAATSLGKAEDAVHASGDTGVASWGVRNDGAATAFTSANGDYSPLATDANGSQFIRETPANTGTTSNVTAATTSTQLIAANTLRRFVVIYNDSASDMYLKYGTAASSTSFTALIPSLALVTIQAEEYAGVLHGIWNTATGTARVTETT